MNLAMTLAEATGSPTMQFVNEAIHIAAISVGVIGVLVLLLGIAVSCSVLVRAELCRFRGINPAPEQERLRRTLGLYLLLGLEFLIAADIIETIIAPTLEALAVLGAIVLIRTVISVSLNHELKHAVSLQADTDD